MLKALYKCPQQELYTIARMGWRAFLLHLTAFELYKSKYTAAFAQARLDEIEAAADLPDDQARTADAEELRINMLQATKVCLSHFQTLKRYIADAYSTEVQKPHIEAAGQKYYEKASNNNWDSIRGLLTSGVNYVKQHQAALSNNDNMPNTFLTAFEDAKKTFVQLHDAFLTSEETAQVQTQDKLIANNEVYTKLRGMFLDGQEIFAADEAVKRKFVFAEGLYLVSGAGTAGVKGYVTDAETQQIIMDALVTIVFKNRSTQTDNEGRYEMLQVASGFYTLKFEKTGYQTLLIENHEIKTGTTSKVDVALQPIDNIA